MVRMPRWGGSGRQQRALRKKGRAGWRILHKERRASKYRRRKDRGDSRALSKDGRVSRKCAR